MFTAVRNMFEKETTTVTTTIKPMLNIELIFSMDCTTMTCVQRAKVLAEIHLIPFHRIIDCTE